MEMRIIKIKGCKTCNEVLAYLDRNDQGEDFVKLVAWHKTKNGDFIQTAEIDCCKSDNDRLMMKNYISDISDFTANAFANSMLL